MHEIGLLGPLQIDGRDAAVTPRDRVVLSALAINPGEVLAADRLAEALWGEEPPVSWAKVVQGCVMRLRRVLGTAAIETTPSGYRLVAGATGLDTERFEELVTRGRDLALTASAERAGSAFERSLALWRGAPFAELDGWTPARSEAARLEELRRSVEEDLLECRLAAGDHRDVAAAGEVLVAAEPLRERRWALLALAQYRGGRQADALRSIAGARRTLLDELGVDPGHELVELEQAILRQDPTLASASPRGSPSDLCPYKGLAHYEVADADSYFGRDAEIAACLARLESRACLVLTGPSGCGKSSLMRAGLMPAMQRRGASVAVVAPGADPLNALAAAIASTPVAPVLFVDQFEELFAPGTSADTARAVCRQLATYATERAQVVIAVRADHLAGIAADAVLARLAEQGLHIVSPLDGDRLRAAIEGPAEQAGLKLEPGLVDLLVRDTDGAPGALPLLSHALVETWRRRDGRVLTVDGYRATGGIRGAVARSADRLYESLPDDERRAVRSVLLRLVTQASDGEPIRSRVIARALCSDPTRERVVDLLVRARLVTTEEDTVELAHEALARAWPRLRSWLDDDADGQRILRHLSAAADGWEGLGRPSTELYRGARLDRALEWRHATAPDLTGPERAFLDASAAEATAEHQAVAERARQQARQNRRLRMVVAAGAVFLVALLVAGAVAMRNGAETARQRDAARAAGEDARLEALVNRSLALRDTNRDVAALLAVEAYHRRPDANAWSALLGTFTAAPGFMGYDYLPANAYVSGTLVPGASSAVVALDGRQLALLDLDTGELESRFPPADADAHPHSMARVSGDGRFVAHYLDAGPPLEQCLDGGYLLETDSAGCARLSVYDLASGERVMGPVEPPFGSGDVAINHDGSIVAVAGGYDGDLAVYRTTSGALLGHVDGVPRPDGVSAERSAAVAFGADGRLYFASVAGPVRVFEPDSMTEVAALDVPARASHLQLLVAADGTLYGSGNEHLVAIDTATGQLIWSADSSTGSAVYPCLSFAIAEQAGRLYCGSANGAIEERDLGTGQRTGVTLENHLSGSVQVAVAPAGRDLVVFGADAPVITRWRVDGSGLVIDHVAAGRALVDGYDPTGRALLVADREVLEPIEPHPRTVEAWDPDADAAATTIHDDFYAAAWAGPDLLGVIDGSGQPGMYDLASGERVGAAVTSELDASVAGSWLPPGSRWFYVAHALDGRCELRRFDVSDGSRAEPTIAIDECTYVRSVGATPTGDRVAVTMHPNFTDTVTTVYDGNTGAELRSGLDEQSEVAVSARGTLVAAASGRIVEFDLDTLRPVGEFPGSRGSTRLLRFSDDGSLLFAVSYDQTVSIYDVATRTRLGDPIRGSAPNAGMSTAWPRPDGGALAVSDRTGIAVWHLDPGVLAAMACRLAGRNLTATERATYLGDLAPSRPACDSYG